MKGKNIKRASELLMELRNVANTKFAEKIHKLNGQLNSAYEKMEQSRIRFQDPIMNDYNIKFSEIYESCLEKKDNVEEGKMSLNKEKFNQNLDNLNNSMPEQAKIAKEIQKEVDLALEKNYPVDKIRSNSQFSLPNNLTAVDLENVNNFDKLATTSKLEI